ncbi:MAG: hypothetical protein LBK99_19935 [Opitutaceae bacterium]|jgi:hypothetical protein|nr:hypothetical protein [Opitutaceae bacterium]
MSNTGYIPATDEDFHLWQENFIAYLVLKAATFGLTTADLAPLMAAQATWRDTWQIAQSPATRTSPAIHAKNHARQAYDHLLREFVAEHLASSKKVTDEDRKNLGIPVHKTTHTHITAPATHPVAEQHGNQPGLVELHFRDEQGTRRGKPRGARCAEVASDVRDTPPADPSEFAHSEIATRSPFKKQFRADQRGLKMYYAMRWESPTGEKGPWSPLSFHIMP